ncbi:hypothetical protein BC629DRAFT_1445460 [Irpex lacteus]|nr:hypothetical protein BC629DRAFT_1445460 [Irpex lacteus]
MPLDTHALGDKWPSDRSNLTMMEVPRIEGSLNDVLGVRYSAGCALMLTIWDILITLDKEVTFVWSNSPGLPHIILVLTRYCNLVSLIYANYSIPTDSSAQRIRRQRIRIGGSFSAIDAIFSLIGKVHLQQCKALPVIFGVLVLAFSLSYNVYVALHLYGLWDQRRRMRTVLCIAIAVLYIPVLSIVSLGLKTLYRDTMFLSALHTCILSGNDTFTKVAFGCMPAFDVFVILLTAYNVLDRPRRPQERFTVEMRRDGALWFLILFGPADFYRSIVDINSDLSHYIANGYSRRSQEKGTRNEVQSTSQLEVPSLVGDSTDGPQHCLH